MGDLTELLADTSTRIAVVGATDDSAKYGSVVYRDLKRKGYRVMAVNPNRTTVDGDPTYPDLASLPEPPDIVDLVVPADQGEKVVRQAADLGYRRIWLQPGADSPALLALLQELDLDYIADACIMVASRLRLAR
ncbi:MAG: CoA-binding protein [Acidimicrobiia bacterium]|nr:MAG: CoA-binding protein [Acidimicrobiia bacterium]